jgi:hypothetical protein
MHTDKQVGASFNATTTHTLTVDPPIGTGTGSITSSDSDGIDCDGTAPDDCTAVVDEGAQITLTANPSVGSTFGGFRGDDASACTAGASTCTLTMDQARTVTATFTDIEDSATAKDDTATVAENSGATTVDVRANDTDPDATKDLITGKTNGSHGTVAITNGGADLTYAPSADYCGSDSFTYTLAGGSSADVAVTVTCIDDPVEPTDPTTPTDPIPPTDPGDPIAPGPQAAPETTIGKFPKNPKGAHTHFRFRSSSPGSTFTCRLDKQEPESCERQINYRNLEPGRHKFKVFATSPQGVADPTPAKARFRISD